MNYSNYKRFKCFSNVSLNIAKAHYLKQKIPFMLELQVTKACNLKCKYCYADLENLQDKDFSFSQIKEIIEEFYCLGTRVVRILGGEPLIRKDIGKIIRYLRSKDMFIELATNGIFIELWLEDLRYLDILQISIDGNEESHDAVRGKGSYQKVLRGLEAAITARLPVRIHGVFNKISIDASRESQVDALAKLSKKYNIPFNFCQYVLGEEEKQCGVINKPAYVSFADTSKYHRELVFYKRKGYRFFNSYAAMRQIMSWPNPEQDVLYQRDRYRIPPYFSRCRAGDLYCFLDSDGSLYPCVPLWKKGLNIKEVGIRQAWKTVQKIRQEEGCFCCVSLGDIEFSKTLSLKPDVLINTFSKVLSIAKSNFLRNQRDVTICR